MRYFLYVGIVVLLGLAALWWLATIDGTPDGQDGEDGTNGTEQPEEMNGDEPDNDDPTGYRSITSEELDLQVLVPEDARTNNPSEDRLSIRFLGPNNEAGTEIQDGFVVTLFQQMVGSTSTLGSLMNVELRDLETQQLALRAGPATTTFSGETALRITHGTQLGNDSTLLIVKPSETVAYTVSYSIYGADTSSYEAMIDTILESVQFIPASTPGTETVTLALLNYDGQETDPGAPVRGCDTVHFVEREVTSNDTELTVALSTLFSLDQNTVGEYQHFIASTNETLEFERVERSGGTAEVYLTGEVSGVAGVCDEPRARIQIEETALAVEGINSVEIFLNGVETDLQSDLQN